MESEKGRELVNEEIHSDKEDQKADHKEEEEGQILHPIVGDVITYWFGIRYWRKADPPNPTSYYDDLWRQRYHPSKCVKHERPLPLTETDELHLKDGLQKKSSQQ